MARERVWYSTMNGVSASSDSTVSLYDGPGTVQAVYGELWGGVTATAALAVKSYRWVLNVGAAAADPVPLGADPPGVMLRGLGVAPNRSALAFYNEPAPTLISTEGQRVIGPDEQLWLRLATLSASTTWFWLWSVRVLVLLPET